MLPLLNRHAWPQVGAALKAIAPDAVEAWLHWCLFQGQPLPQSGGVGADGHNATGYPEPSRLPPLLPPQERDAAYLRRLWRAFGGPVIPCSPQVMWCLPHPL